jgi:hypothetical protein
MFDDGIEDLDRVMALEEGVGSRYYLDSARFSRAIACFLSHSRESALRDVSLTPVNVTTYLAGRLWTVADLKKELAVD